jgi:hypothetical protein
MMDVRLDPERIMDYLDGRLSEEEDRAFGDRLIRDPQLVRELERTVQLREGLRALEARGHFRNAATTVQRRRIGWPALAAAATVAAIGLFLWVGLRSERPNALITVLSAAVTAPANVTARFTFVATRGGVAPVLNLPREGFIEFRAAPGSAGSSTSYNVSLQRAEASGAPEPLGFVSQVDSAADGYLHLYADATRLQPGRYLLRTQPRGAEGAESKDFPFTLQDTSSTLTR